MPTEKFLLAQGKIKVGRGYGIFSLMMRMQYDIFSFFTYCMKCINNWMCAWKVCARDDGKFSAKKKR
ncbi:MAG: hypothetical protein EGS53_08840 [Prevotella sp.]|nr:hypothetical protein [Prevotella sp.]